MNVKLIASIVLALLFSIIPLPDLITHFRPLFLPLVCIYWAIYHSHSFGIGKAWIAGIILDALHGTILGQTALALTFVVGACLFYKRRFQLSAVISALLWPAVIVIMQRVFFKGKKIPHT